MKSMYMDIKGWNGKYKIDESGNVMSHANYNNREPALRKTHCGKRGYVVVDLVHKGYRKNLSIHRLVAETFIPNPDGKPEVNHIDGDKTNNHVSNLEWCTRKENARHAIDTGLCKLMSKNEGNLKYTNEQCREVLDQVKNGLSYSKAGKLHNMPYSTVAHLVRGSRRSV